MGLDREPALSIRPCIRVAIPVRRTLAILITMNIRQMSEYPLALAWFAILALAILTALSPISRPATGHAQIEDALKVDVRVERIDRLYGAQFVLRYDATQLRPLDADPRRPGLQMEVGPAWGPSLITLVNEVDERASEARFSATLLGDAPALRGNLVLASVYFEQRRLELEDAYALTAVDLYDRGAEPIEAVWEGVVIRPVIDWLTLSERVFMPVAWGE